MAEQSAERPPEEAQGGFRLGGGAETLAKNATLVVGILYALGALHLWNQLRGGGVSTTEVLRLIPLDHHLTRGLGILLSSVGLLLALLLVAALFVFEALAERQPATRPGEPGEKQGRVRRWVSTHRAASLAILAAPYVALLIWRPILVGQQLVSMTVVFLILSAVTYFARGTKVPPSTRVVVIALGLSAGFIVRGFFFPPPLALVEVTPLNAPPVRGQFIDIVNNNWYMAPRNGVIEAVGDKFVVTGRIIPRQRPDDWNSKSLPELVGN